MPAIANITVKKNDGTTDIVWTAQAPSSGDGTPAVWKSLTAGTAPALQPELRASSKDVQQAKVREVVVNVHMPWSVTDTTNGVTSARQVMRFRGVWDIPREVPTTVSDEFASQTANLVASTLLKDTVKTGYAPS